MSLAALLSTTLSAALAATTRRFAVASTTSITAGTKLVCGAEIMLVQAVPISGVVEVMRGIDGTTAAQHPASAQVHFADGRYIGRASYDGRVELVGDPGTLPQFVLPVGGRRIDPNTGFEYLLIDCQAAFEIGSFVVIDGAGLATALATTSKGRVGIVVETIAGSDTLSWVLVVGTYASALTTSDVTTAADLIAGAACADILTSTGGNIIWNAACTVAPSTATSPTAGGALATVYVCNPWVSGEIHSFSSVGT